MILNIFFQVWKPRTTYSVFQKLLYREEKSNSALLRTVIRVETCLNVLERVYVWEQEWGKELVHVHTFWTIFVIQ
jgi:hypothetical protein